MPTSNEFIYHTVRADHPVALQALAGLGIDDPARVVALVICADEDAHQWAARAFSELAIQPWGGVPPDPPGALRPLTSRELDVLRLMVLGHTNPEIAAALKVSRSTIRTHISNILSKLGARNRIVAVVTAVRQNLVGGRR